MSGDTSIIISYSCKNHNICILMNVRFCYLQLGNFGFALYLSLYLMISTVMLNGQFKLLVESSVVVQHKQLSTTFQSIKMIIIEFWVYDELHMLLNRNPSSIELIEHSFRCYRLQNYYQFACIFITFHFQLGRSAVVFVVSNRFFNAIDIFVFHSDSHLISIVWCASINLD